MSVVRIINGQQDFQTGITVFIIWLILEKGQQLATGKAQHTVHSNGHGFSQDVSICANKGGDPAQRIELEVFKILNRRLGLDEFDI